MQEDASQANTPPSTSISRQLIHSTVLLNCWNRRGEHFTGTGFLFVLFHDKEHQTPVIVSNKHVIAGAKKASITLTRRHAGGGPDYGNVKTIPFENFEYLWFFHPDRDVDLAVLPMNPTLLEQSSRGEQFFGIWFNATNIPSEFERKKLDAVEELLIVGYPNGVSDTKNNSPITRRGITATAPFLDFNGERKFLIDASIYPGSSGSPVFIYNNGIYSNGAGGMQIGGRLMLLGVVFAVTQQLLTGEIKVVPAPTDTKSLAVTLAPSNLGLCINSSRILEFEKSVPKAYPFPRT